MKLLGAILAGGQSRRFGSDKAEAMLNGRSLIEHVADALGRSCGALVVCGREYPSLPSLEDRPRAGLGPLGGLCAALAYGKDAGFDAVLSAPCDAPGLPEDILPRLSEKGGSAYVVNLPVIGLWPCALAGQLHAYLEQEADRSLRAWARAASATPVELAHALTNINTPVELAALQRDQIANRGLAGQIATDA
ncbi:molybdenum cofactor guanylyltransferase [Sphingomonas koreensis]